MTGLTRRSFVAGSVGAMAVVALGGTAKAWGGSKELLRPPGAQDEQRLFERCIRCERCSMVCPQRAIRLAKIEDGIINMRTPKLDFHKGFCDFCQGNPKCAEVCPTDSFVAFVPRADKIGIANVDTEQCLLYHASSKCSKRCLDVCAWQALYLNDDGLLKVDETHCNGCGACEFVCPSASYQVAKASLNRGINIESLAGGQ